MSEYDVQCPHPDCVDAVLLTWAQCYSLSPEDLFADERDEIEPIKATDAHTSGWQIECAAGHVLLLPGSLGCPCGYHSDADECPHDEELYDWSEDNRTLRPHDYQRLRAVVAVLQRDAEERAL